MNFKTTSIPEYRADIDGLRAIAVLLVVFFHAFPLIIKGGFIGVDVFFVISGYLISKIILTKLENENFSFVDFYSRRIMRIFPSLIIVLITCYAFGWFSLLGQEFEQLNKHITRGIVFLSNIVLWRENGYFDISAELKPLLHLWSLSIEEQFYVLWPLLLFFAWKKKLNLFYVIILSLTISFALNIYQISKDPFGTFYLPHTRFWEILIGSLLAHIKINKNDLSNLKISFSSNFQSFLGSLLIVLSVLLITKAQVFPGWWALMPTIGAALIISAGSKAWVNHTILSNKYLVWVGLISFPLYLWHWPLLSYAKIYQGEFVSIKLKFVLILLSFLLAWMTYKLIETPFRFGGNSRKKLLVLITTMLAIGAVSQISYRKKGLVTRSVVLRNEDFSGQYHFKSNPDSVCVDTGYPAINSQCTSNLDKDAKKTVFIWGDSSVGAWNRVFLEVGKERHINMIMISQPSCLPLLETRKIKSAIPGFSKYCSDGKNAEHVISYINKIKPDIIIVIAAWNVYSPLRTEYSTDLKSDEVNKETTLNSLRKRVPETLRELEKISKLIVFKSWPVLPSNPNYKLTRIPFLTSYKAGERKLETVEFLKDSESINKIFEDSHLLNAVFFDPSTKYCHKTCDFVTELGVKLYVDTYHITPYGSIQFKNEVENMLL